MSQEYSLYGHSCARTLVITLSCGERELPECKKSVANQKNTDVHHHVISGLPSAEAHAALYRTVMRMQGEYDLFVKLDGDMVFATPEAVSRIRDYFSRNVGLDHAVFPVYDHLTNRNIVGFHTFSWRSAWSASDEQLFVDPNPYIPGYSNKKVTQLGVMVDHAPYHSSFQAFCFGVHRTLKIVQRDRSVPYLDRSIMQLRHMIGLRAVAMKVPRDERKLCGLIGSVMTLRGHFDSKSADRDDPKLVSEFGSLDGHDSDTLSRMIPFWAKSSLSYIVAAVVKTGVSRVILAACLQSNRLIQIVLGKLLSLRRPKR